MKDATDLKQTPRSAEVVATDTDLDPHDDSDDQDALDDGDDAGGWSGKVDVSGTLTNQQLGEE